MSGAPQGHSEAAKLAWLHENHEDVRARLAVSTEVSVAGLKSLQLINGGAIIALFSVLATNSEFAQRLNEGEIYAAFASFALGLGAGLAAFILGYTAQEHFSAYEQDVANQTYFTALGGIPTDAIDDRPRMRGERTALAASLSAVLGLLCFLIGAGVCLHTAMS